MSTSVAARRLGRRGPYLAVVGLLSVALAAAALGWVYASFGSVRAAVGYAGGHELATAAAVVDLAAVGPGESRPFVVRVVNHSPRPYRVVGSNNLCQCVIDTDLPATVPAGGALDLDLTLRVPRASQAGEAGCVVELVTDAPRDVLLAQAVRYTVR